MYFLSSPLEIDIDITNKCNLHCLHCRTSKDTSSELNSELWEIVSDQIIDAKIPKVVISGGEPFLNRFIFDLIDKLTKNNILVEIRTNATVLKEVDLDFLINHGINRLFVSLDGPREIHNLIRGSNSFELMADNLHLIKKKGIELYLNMILMDWNKDYIIETAKTASELGADILSINCYIPVQPVLGNHDAPRSEREKWAKDIEKARILFPSLKITHNIPFFSNFPVSIEGNELQKYSMGCKCGRTKATIFADGSVVACKMIPTVIAGNVKERTIKEIWQDEQAFLLFRGNSSNDSKCNGCEVVSACRGGCKAYTFATVHTFNARDPRCERSA